MEIMPTELKKKIDKKEDFILVGVREAWERQICHIQGDRHIPLVRVPAEAKRLPKDRQIITYCHSGNRSMHAAVFLRGHGFDAYSLKGGIDDWAEMIDREMEKYGFVETL